MNLTGPPAKALTDAGLIELSLIRAQEAFEREFARQLQTGSLKGPASVIYDEIKQARIACDRIRIKEQVG